MLLFLLFGRGVVFFCCLGGGVFICLLFGRVACLCFCCLGGGRVFVCCLGGDGSSLTYRSAWLVFKQPNNKKDQTAKKTRVPLTF